MIVRRSLRPELVEANAATVVPKTFLCSGAVSPSSENHVHQWS